MKNNPTNPALKTMRPVLIAAMLLACTFPALAQQPTYLYKASLVQAAPGRLLELIEIYKDMATEDSKNNGGQPPLWMRHSQGDRWDLLILSPVGTYADYYQPSHVAQRERIFGPWREKLQQDIAWQEDLFAYGPPLADVRKAFAGAGFFHVEMFQSLPGKQTELYRQREMENAYSAALHLTQNLIFVRDQGAAWDVFTIGCYRDLKQFAASGDTSESDQQAAAKAAGFESPAQIGPYLRTLISLHRDTLAVAVK